MKLLFLSVLFSAALFTSISQANAPENHVDGNQIQEPFLTDYVRAERTPGFSPVTDIIDSRGNHLSE